MITSWWEVAALMWLGGTLAIACVLISTRRESIEVLYAFGAVVWPLMYAFIALAALWKAASPERHR